MLKKTLLAAVVLGLSTTAVQAYEMSGYVSGNLGQARASKPKTAKFVQNDWANDPAADSTGTSTDRTDTAYKFAVGLQANKYLAVELQYIDLGESTYKARGATVTPCCAWEGNAKLKSETSGFGANLVATYPLENLTFFAKAGYHYLKTKSSYKYHESDTSPYLDNQSDSKTTRKWTPSFGGGVAYNFTREFAVVAEYERYKGVARSKDTIKGEKLSMKHDIDLASVGLRYTF